MGILFLLAFLPALFAAVGFVGEALRPGARGVRSEGPRRLPPMWPRKGPCFGEPSHEGGQWFGGRPGELFSRRPAGDREFMR